MSIFKKGTLKPNVEVEIPKDPMWLEIAKKELGQKEVPGSGVNKRILEYFDFTSYHPTYEDAWCSAFVNWCMARSNIKGTGSASARSWLKWGKEEKQFRRGAVVIFSRGSNPAFGHVAFCLRDLGESIEVLGGNQDDSVSVKQYPKEKVLGYRWPKFINA